jgi:hypothetical protein
MRILICVPTVLFSLLAACMHANSHAPEQSTIGSQTVPARESRPDPPPGTFVPTPTTPSEQPSPRSEAAKPQAQTPSAATVTPKPANADSKVGKLQGTAALKKPAAGAPAASGPAASPPASLPPAASTAKPQLDFKAMEQRLRDTSAIGVFTKLSIKNQVDDLLKAFRGYHAGHLPPTLDELHQRYDGLLLKVVTLVQDDDATLASSISASRGAIWERLSNKESFQAI